MNFKPTVLKIIISLLLGILFGIIFVESLNVFLMEGENEDATSILSVFFWIFIFILIIYLFLSLITKRRDNPNFVNGANFLPQINNSKNIVQPTGDKWWMNV
ncbi:MAG: hypothetical protein WC867_05540 [Candidatus Pacearchaeota archaeon]|jgi:Na+/proline symporter